MLNVKYNYVVIVYWYSLDAVYIKYAMHSLYILMMCVGFSTVENSMYTMHGK